MAVFKVDKDFIIVNKDALKLVPELSALDQDQLRYVILVVDYVDGPYRKKPLDERRNMAKKKVFGKTDVEPETAKVKIAMEAYKSLIFDIRRETIDVYNQRIKTMQKEILDVNITYSRMIEVDKMIRHLQDRITDMNKQLDIEEGENIELMGKAKLSYIEIWQRNQKAFREFQGK